MNGILVVDKPPSMTSRDIVNRVQRLLPRKTRVGHAGTLDPMATGVLVVCIGAATRLVEYVQRMDKEYFAEAILGATSSTDDADGEISPTSNAVIPTLKAVREQLPHFLGNVMQTPPAFSAIKINGRRSYKLAREGRSESLAPRSVRIDEVDAISLVEDRLTLRVRCGKGVYIRSLARDLGERFECGAYLTALRRTRIGVFAVNEAVSCDALDHALANQLQPLTTAVAELPSISISDEQLEIIRHGRALATNRLTIAQADGDEAALMFGTNVAAVARYSDDRARLLPVKVLPWP